MNCDQLWELLQDLKNPNLNNKIKFTEMNRLALILAVLMAFVLTSCEKEKVAEMIENNAASTLKPANFVLIQKGYVDEDGFVGDLYYNESNPKRSCLVLYEQQTRAHQPTWTGTLDPVYVTDPDSGATYIHDYVCNEEKEATNCKPTSNGGFITSAEFSVIFMP